MSVDRFRQIEKLFHAVREAAGNEREELLAAAEPELRREVESLLRQPTTGEFLDQSTLFVQSALQGIPSPPPAKIDLDMTPGARLGPYRIEGKVGEGGMGEVFRAIDTRLGRAVAIKTNRAEFNPRFEREARAISSLNHPNICTLFDVGPGYLVMELVEGETLAARLKSGPLPLRTAALYGSQIAAALAEAHGKGIVHRDLKPGNIMIGKACVKVLDFGLARSVDDETVTATRMVVGTPAYMAPEQREGKSVDARADIYALGCVLYEMLTAERASLGRKRISSRKWESVVKRCLEADPNRRWQSAADLQRELEGSPKANRVVEAAAVTSSTAAPKPARKHTILLGEVENKTGNAVFDGLLRQSLSVQLELSTALALISDQQIQQTLRLMERPPETRLTSEVGHEICERLGGTALLEGSIAKLGNQYIVWLGARNCTSGDILAQEQVQAKEDEVLDAFGGIATKIRERLSGSLSTIEQPLPLEPATTSSLEALKAYSAGQNAVFHRGFAAAIPHLQRAVALDPQFAMAHGHLGFYYNNTGQTELGVQHVLKAYALREGVSERERFYIQFLYERQVTGNLHKELATIDAWTHTFPQDFHAWGVLGGWGTRGTGQYERGLQAGYESLRLNPAAPFPYDALTVHNTSLGRFKDASAAMQLAAERKIELPFFLVHRYYLAFFDGDEAGMKREVDRARGHRESEDWMLHNQALVLARSGQMRSARTMWHHAIVLAQQNGDPARAAIYHAAVAVCEAHFGNHAAAKERARAALELAQGRDVIYAAAFALALSGDDAASQDLAESLARKFPEDTPVQFEYLPILRALSALARHAPLDAIEHLQTALPYDLAMPGTAFFAKFGGMYSVYVRGRAYLEAGHGQKAAAEFQKILDHSGIVLADPIGVLAHLQLARTLTVSGDKNEARSAYQQFFILWKDADQELPILQQARQEYEAL